MADATYWTYLERKSESCSVMSDYLQPHGLYRPWNSPGQSTGVDSLSLSPEELPNPGIKPGSPALQMDSLPTELSGICLGGGLVAKSCLAPATPSTIGCQAPLSMSYKGSPVDISYFLIFLSVCHHGHSAMTMMPTNPASLCPTSLSILFLISSSHFSTVWLHMVYQLPQFQRAVFTTHGYSVLTMAQPGTPLRTGQGELGLRTSFCLQMESIQPPCQPLLFAFPLASLD